MSNLLIHIVSSPSAPFGDPAILKTRFPCADCGAGEQESAFSTFFHMSGSYRLPRPWRRCYNHAMGIERARVLVYGIVQGVFFRATTVETAQKIGGITGWVRNLPDGGVEAVAEGEREDLDIFVGWLRHGPPGASVDGLDVTWGAATGEYSGFHIVY